MNTKALCQALRGSRAHVLIAFLLARSCLGIDELREWTGLKRETLYAALADLAAFGLVEKQVGRHGRTTWLPAGDTLQLSVFRTAALDSSSGIIPDSLKENPEEERQESVFRTPVHDALIAGGVRDPKAAKLAGLEWATVEFVNAHLERAKEQGHSIGTAIYRIENEWPIEIKLSEYDERHKYVQGKYGYLFQHDDEEE